MKLWLCPNLFTPEQAEQVKTCIAALERGGLHQCFLSASDSFALEGNEARAGVQPADCEMILSLGGDGAALRAAKIAVRCGKPLFGINSGRLGYLCAMELQDISRFDEIAAGCRISRRSILCADDSSQQVQALNDIVIAKEHFGETVDLTLCIDGGESFQIRGDGVIFSTPTGSTAYNLSAGGPTLEPDMQAMVMTPICPHAGLSHPVVLGPGHTIVIGARDRNAGLFADGVKRKTITAPVEVRLAQESLTLYTGNRTSRLNIL